MLRRPNLCQAIDCKPVCAVLTACRRLQGRLSQRIDAKVLKLLIESGKTTIKMMRQRELLEERMDALDWAFKQSARADETLSWNIQENEEEGTLSVQFQRRDHGRVMISRLDKDLVSTAEFSEAQRLCASLQNLVDDGAYLSQGRQNMAGYSFR